MLTLRNREVYSQIKEVVKKNYASGPNQGKPFFVMSHGTRGFILPEDVYKDWKAGQLAELSLEESNYDREVINEDESVTTVNVPSMTFAGSISKSQLAGLKDVIKLSSEIDNIERSYSNKPIAELENATA